jgi:hypothetical protein
MKQVNLRLSEDLVARIDEVRGDVPRNTWLLRAAELRLMAKNLTPDEIDRLLDDWRNASRMREIEGVSDDTDRGIAQKAPAQSRSGQ